MRNVVCLLLLAVLLVPALGCDKVSPTAPSGTILTISASPAQISLNGTSLITVIGRKPNGSALNEGTEIRLTTTLGSIDPFVSVNRDGVATATLRGDGRQGVATVTAATSSAPSSGGTGGTTGGTGGTGGNGTGGTGGSASGTSSVSLNVEIGGAAKTITLQPSPTTIPATGGRITLRALVRDSRGQALPNQGVNFTTELGRLESGGALRQTDANGLATDTLILNALDLANNPSTITVGAQTAGGDGTLIERTFEITVQSEVPVAAFSYQRGATDLQVDFDNQSTGPNPQNLTYNWTFGDGTSSVDPDPLKTYSGPGTYNVRLTVTDSSSGLSDVASAQITVPVTQPGGSN